MIKYECECLYCGYRFELPSLLAGSYDPSCPKCSDKKIKVKKVDHSSRDVFGYNHGKSKEEEIEWVNPHDYD